MEVIAVVGLGYPGATEEVCIPVLELASGLQWPRDFNVAYSPERINPGDQHTRWPIPSKWWLAIARAPLTALPRFMKK